MNIMIQDFAFWLHVELYSFFLLVFFTDVGMIFISVIKYIINSGMSRKDGKEIKSFYDNPLQSCSVFLQEKETKYLLGR